ncbi:deoxyribodipyrimidine photo-lyase [Halovenus aranensis]|uniref:Deoxyribodipyrimidine photo-lyase n=1 Tax=Halovenus aranensis TaxID=890420 RepID=A0A1G8X925_9EURY|nr:deoxyribodipyrimidine photo-lyase [Halovenus aranensis]SDJ86365.1 deoxyribodipyrimidine photo-lyase [Halovenus aranensis]
MAPSILVWHRDDLRVRDNAALAAAVDDGHAHPLFVFDPRFYRSSRVCDSRLAFLHECLDELADAYEHRGGGLAYRHGDPREVLDELLTDGVVDRVYMNATTTAGYARERDDALASREAVRVFSDDAIVRTGDSRDGWQEQAEAYFAADQHDPPEAVAGELASTTDITEITTEYDLSPSKRRQYRGGCVSARERLDAFADAIGDYVGGISAPAKAQRRTSHLSAYLKFGCLSPREAYQYVDERGDGRGVELFTSRLYWNRHFTQKLADNPDATEHAINPVFRGMNRERHDPALAEAWKRGETGFPMVDASMRALRETGWLNFRMRAMCASFFTYILRCWWKVGADWFYRHLIDADPAINYQQWQMQSGLVGVHPLRIYNPRKQVREHDPDGEFIREYVPELADLPATFLDEPSKAPVSVQAEHGVSIGDDYPYPVVDFEQRREAARETWAALDERAKEALADPEIRRRASLSSRRDDRDESRDTGGQATLDDFTP